MKEGNMVCCVGNLASNVLKEEKREVYCCSSIAM